MKIKCSTPHCSNEPVLQLLGKYPLCRACGDVKNAKARKRSAVARAKGHYSPAIKARWSEEKKRRMTKYTQRSDGEGFEVPNGQVYKLACCDCGLVHQIVILAPGVEKGTPLGFAAKRDNRATAARRRKSSENTEVSYPETKPKTQADQ